jgi:hypothetical protein
MIETISAEIIYCRARAGLARGKGDTSTSAEEKNDYLASEERWFVLARSYELQERLSKALDRHERSKGSVGTASERADALDPEFVAILSSAFRAVFAELDLSDSDKIIFALWVGRCIIELAARGEHDPDRFKVAIRAWATK